MVVESPLLLAAVVPAIAMMLVNGWTDAPVAIATAVRSGAIKLKSAIILAAVCNFLGAALMIALGNSVATSIYSLSGMGKLPIELVGNALICAMLSVVVWSLFALYYGIPTSESHALLSALFGAAAAVVGSQAFDKTEWLKVLLGIFLAAAPNLFIALVLSKWLEKTFSSNTASTNVFKKSQIFGAALSSFAHGAQDGQKFGAVLTVTASVCVFKSEGTVYIPIWTVVLSAGFISLGMLLGGKRIIKSFDSFASPKASSGFASDIVSALTLFIMSLFGIPASTTHAKTCAVLGASISRNNFIACIKATVKMTLFWGLTFPVCIGLSFILSHIMLFFSRL